MKNIENENWLRTFLKTHNLNNNLYWYPLVNVRDDVHVVAYDIKAIYENNAYESLIAVMKACNIGLVHMFQMDHCEYFEDGNIETLLNEKEEDAYIFPKYSETYIFDNTKEWLIYLSHEETISFTGKDIVEQAKIIIDARYLY